MIGQLPRFVADEEVAEAARLSKELEKRRRARRSLTPAMLYERNRKLKKEYCETQSDDELDQLQKKLCDVQFLLANPRLRSAALNRLELFAKNDVRPFLRGILTRALKISEETLAKVIAGESARVSELTGGPLTFSDLVVRQQRVVLCLSELLSRLSVNSRPLLADACFAGLAMLPKMASAGQGPNGNDTRAKRTTLNKTI